MRGRLAARRCELVKAVIVNPQAATGQPCPFFDLRPMRHHVRLMQSFLPSNAAPITPRSRSIDWAPAARCKSVEIRHSHGGVFRRILRILGRVSGVETYSLPNFSFRRQVPFAVALNPAQWRSGLAAQFVVGNAQTGGFPQLLRCRMAVDCAAGSGCLYIVRPGRWISRPVASAGHVHL